MEEVAAQIQTKDILETNRLLYATAVVVTEIIGIKPGKKKETREPWWKKTLQGQVDQMRKELSRLEQICRNECSRPRIRNQLWRKYEIETKGVTVVTEELKQRISAKAHKINRYRLTRGSFTENLMIHREVTNWLSLLMLMKPESFGVIFGGPASGTKRDADWLNDLKGNTRVEQHDGSEHWYWKAASNFKEDPSVYMSQNQERLLKAA